MSESTALVVQSAGPVVQASVLERALARVAPSYALRRYEARCRFEAASWIMGSGGYAGARNDRQATKNFQPRIDGPDSATLPDIRPLRARAADLERNDPIAGGAVSTVETWTVGTGIRAHSRVDRKMLGLTDEEGDALDEQIDRLFDAWADSKCCDLSGRSDFYGLQALALRTVLGRGDALAVRRFVERPGHLYGTKVQLVEGDRVATPDGTMETDRLRAGVEIDEYGVMVAFYVQDQHPGDSKFGITKSWKRIVAESPESREWHAVLLYRELRPGQTRGVPFLAPVIEKLKQLSRLSEAELMASLINALFAVFVKTDGEMATLPDMKEGAPGLAGTSAATQQSTDPRELNLGSGIVVKLQPGEEIQLADPKRPNAQYDPFFVACVREVGAALEIPFEILLKNFTSSYSASRAAFLEFWRVVMRRRMWLVRDFCAPFRDAVIAEAVSRGHLNAPGFFDSPLVRRAFTRAAWVGTAMGALNPIDEANAAQKFIDIGVSTIADETIRITGGDFAVNHAQRVKEHKARAAAGLEPQILAATGTFSSATDSADSPNTNKPKTPAAPAPGTEDNPDAP